MTEECPNCKQTTNTSFSRLIKDTCGHTKCRLCLLYEEQGCKICDNIHAQNVENFDDLISNRQLEDKSIEMGNSNTTDDIIQPLELVTNKSFRSKENIENLNVNVNFVCITNTLDESSNSTREDHSDKMSTMIEPMSEAEITHIAPSVPENLNDLNTGVNCDFKEKLDRSHISIIPGDPVTYKCNICSKIFRNKKGQYYHDACKTGIKPYQCKFCPRSFVKRSHFEYHERVHSGYKPYKCNLCDKAFPQQNKLKRHMYSHSEEKRFVCHECGKSYNKSDDLKNHLTIHNGIKPHSCESCNKSFRLLSTLKRHMRSHGSERPYKCDKCNKSFKDNSLLARHKKIHGEERPFSCADCNRVFVSKSELRRHLTAHSDVKPFTCEYCQTEFRRKDNLNRHIKHHHSEDSTMAKDRVEKTSKKTINNSKQKLKRNSRINVNPISNSPSKNFVLSVNSHAQINSRLDSMGNITPIIKKTNELSNAVPVIYRPISIRKSEDKTDCKQLIEPIPPAEVVVINRRIEEKLYSQTTSNHNYFFRQNMNDKSNSPISTHTTRTNNSSSKILFLENCSLEPILPIHSNFTFQQTESNYSEFLKKKDQNLNKTTTTEDKYQKDNVNASNNKYLLNLDNHCEVLKEDDHYNSESIADTSKNNSATNTPISEKTEQFYCKKQYDVHWRRRTAETLKSPNQ